MLCCGESALGLRVASRFPTVSKEMRGGNETPSLPMIGGADLQARKIVNSLSSSLLYGSHLLVVAAEPHSQRSWRTLVDCQPQPALLPSRSPSAAASCIGSSDTKRRRSTSIERGRPILLVRCHRHPYQYLVHDRTNSQSRVLECAAVTTRIVKEMLGPEKLSELFHLPS